MASASSFTEPYALPALQGFLPGVTQDAGANSQALTLSLADPESLNSYSYTENNPEKYRDPTGKGPELAIPIAFGAAYTTTMLAEYGAHIASGIGQGNYSYNTFFPSSQTVAGFANDAVDNGVISGAAAAAVFAAPLETFSGGALLIGRSAIIGAATFDTSLFTDLYHGRKLNYQTAADRTVGAVTGGYVGGSVPGRYPVYGSQTFYNSMISGAHAQNALVKEGVSAGVTAAGRFNLSAILTAVAGVIAAFSNHK
jgi:hypothetical protein